MKVDSESESHSCHSDLANQVVRRIDLENNKNPLKQLKHICNGFIRLKR